MKNIFIKINLYKILKWFVDINELNIYIKGYIYWNELFTCIKRAFIRKEILLNLNKNFISFIIKYLIIFKINNILSNKRRMLFLNYYYMKVRKYVLIKWFKLTYIYNIKREN